LGAFASIPGVLAANRLGLPVVLLEQNCLPGRATRVLSSRARLTVFGMRVADERIREWPSPTITCGIPVRAGIRDLVKLPVNRVSDRQRILVMGGSQGAESVNTIVTTALCEGKLVPPDWEIVHQTGEGQIDAVLAQYQCCGVDARVAAFLPDIPTELAAASIVVSRAGASTIQELACAGVPSILIPLSTSAEDHQMVNARMMENIGAAVVIDERNLLERNMFATTLGRLITDPEHRQRMAHAARTVATPDAAKDIARILIDIAGRTSSVGSC
jgi:UDP-N-acetylglucosamine--N-acetylmuramyl-(pentapeptide) pyrophosphoryl-undecaprenol N-acetylglucosamine transferase